MSHEEGAPPIPPEATRPLFSALDAPEETLRIAALRALVRQPLASEDWLRIGTRVDHLLKGLAAAKAEPTEEQREAIRAAVHVPLRTVRQRLRQGLETWPPEARSLAARALGRARDPVALAPLVEALGAGELNDRIEAAEFLCRLDVRPLRSRILRALRRAEDPEFRFWVALALAKSGDAASRLEKALAEISARVDDFRPFFADPEPFLRRVEATGPLSGDLAALLRRFASRNDLDERVRAIAAQLLDTLPPGSPSPKSDLTLPEAQDWPRASALVGRFLDPLVSAGERDPLSHTLGGNAIAAYAAALGAVYRPDIPGLFRVYARRGPSEFGLPVQLAWLASRAAPEQVLAALVEPLSSSTEHRLLACRFIEQVTRAGRLSGPPVFGGGSALADVLPPTSDDFLDGAGGELQPTLVIERKGPSETWFGMAGALGAGDWLRALGGLLGRAVRLPRSRNAKSAAHEDDRRSTQSREPPSSPPRSEQAPEPVLLGVSAPREATPGAELIAQFAAYVAAAREEVRRILTETGGAGAKPLLDVRTCQWAIDTPVTVRLTGRHFTVDPPEQTFHWNGRRNQCDFLVSVASSALLGPAVLRFEVYIAGLRVELIATSIELKAQVQTTETAATEHQPGRTAFASYASADREAVAERLSTLQAYDAGIDIFMDCLDLFQGEDYKHRLEREIAQRDRFFLFWSDAASHSRWVDLEWHRRKETRGIDAITPSPLDNPEIVPPPQELGEHLNFRDAFMIAAEAARSLQERKSRPRD